MFEYYKFLFEIIVCFLLSSCIGIERQYRRRAVGLRTIILVSLGSFLFVSFSFAYSGTDMTRIASQVVAGIGFLGAGVIIKDSKSVKGLTTAATLWCAAAIGILCSGGLLFEASVGTLLVLFTNIVLRKVNSKINLLSGNANYNLYFINIVCESESEDEIIKLIKEFTSKDNSQINSIKTEETENGNIKIELSVIDNNSENNIANKIIQKFAGRKDICSISLNKKDKNILSEEEEF